MRSKEWGKRGYSKCQSGLYKRICAIHGARERAVVYPSQGHQQMMTGDEVVKWWQCGVE